MPFSYTQKKKSLLWEGETHTLPHSVASLPRFDPRLTNPSCTTGTGIAKGYKVPCPPAPLDWSEKIKRGKYIGIGLNSDIRISVSSE